MDATLPARTRSTEPGPTNETRLAPLALAALGVVFGDIGTSPLYAFKQCFTTGRGFTPSAEHVLGILSLITWALILVVCVKYATIVLRADNEGEGGTLALLAQLRPSSRVGIPAPMTFVVYMLLFAAGMVFGDGVSTPSRKTIPAAKRSMYTTNVIGAGIPTRLLGRSCASSASVPPSPSLSARSTIVAYFTQTTRIRAQAVSERMPRTCSALGVKPRPVVKHCLNA